MKKAALALGRKLVPLISLALLTAWPSSAQKPEHNVFSPVPAEHRSRLIERLGLWMENENKGELGVMYDMLFGFIPEKMSKEEFIKAASKQPPHKVGSKVGKFIPRIVDREELERFKGAQWRIVGDLKVRNAAGNEEVKEGTVYAQLREGEWYFSGFITVEAGFGSDPKLR